ncbi:hypothetical protein ACWGN9_26790, partial [Streptomyces sp. NPDC055775]
PGATVALSHEGRHLITVTTDSRGVYDVWLKATVPTVTVTDDGYGKRSKKVSVKRGSLTMLYPAGDTLTRDEAEAEAMVKLAAAAAATAGLVAGIAVAKAAPHVKRGLATIEVEFPARTTMLKQPPSELTTP